MKIATIFDYLELDTVSRLKKHYPKYHKWIKNSVDETLKNPIHYINASAFLFSVNGEHDHHVKSAVSQIGSTAFLMKANHLHNHYLNGRGIREPIPCFEDNPCDLCEPPIGWQPTLTNTTRLAVYPVGRLGNDWIFSVWNHAECVVAESFDGGPAFTVAQNTEKRWIYFGMIQISPLGWHCDKTLMEIITSAEQGFHPMETGENPNYHQVPELPGISSRTKYLMENRLFLPFLLLKRCFEIIEPRTKNKDFANLKTIFFGFLESSEHERQAHTGFRWVLPCSVVNNEPVFGQRFNHKGTLVVKVRRPIKASTVKRQRRVSCES